MWQEAAWLNGELPAELRGKKEGQRGLKAGLGCPCRGPEYAGMGLGKPASVRVESRVRGLKGKMGLYGYCDYEY